MIKQDIIPLKSSNTIYKTSELNLAAYLRAQFQLPLKRSDIDQKTKRIVFVFDVKNVNIDSIINDYINGKDECSISSFMRELGGLRTVIRNILVNN